VTNGLQAGRNPEVVPLEAGLSPANPPCPVCGEPLFGWTTAGAEPVRRCEACGLAVIGEPGEEADVLAELERHRLDGGDDPRYRIANRASFQSWLGGSAWAPIAPGTHYLFTEEAVRRLVSDRDQTVTTVRWSPGPGVAAMWATLVNSFTFGRNVGLAALGRGVAEPAGKAWQRRLDAFISVVTAPVVVPVSLLLETGAAIGRRGGAIELTLRLE
jgi:hypothetical protein